MKKIAISLSLLISSSFAVSIDELVSSTLQNNYDLKSIEKLIEVANENIKLATKWKNPTLSLGVNDIHFDEPFKRDKEPMQAQYIGFSQVIPVGKKLDIKKKIAKRDKKIIALSLEDKKLKLKSKVYELSYTILILEKKYKLLNSYERNIKKLERLSKDLYSYSKSNQNEVLGAQILFENLKIKKQNLQNMINNLYLKLEQISYTKVESINNSLDINKLVLNMNIDTHPKVKIQKEKIKKFNNLSSLEKEKEREDIKVNFAYFNRDDKYKDYANISVNIPLSIYKTEQTKSLRAKLQASQVEKKLVDLKKVLKSEFLILQNNMDNGYKNYNVIQESLIPLKRKMQKNIENYNSLTGLKPQMAIKNLNELIGFEIKAYDQLQEYFSNYSKTKYYITKVK